LTGASGNVWDGDGFPRPHPYFYRIPLPSGERMEVRGASGALSMEDLREGRIGEVVGLCDGPVGDRPFRDVHP